MPNALRNKKPPSVPYTLELRQGALPASVSQCHADGLQITKPINLILKQIYKFSNDFVEMRGEREGKQAGDRGEGGRKEWIWQMLTIIPDERGFLLFGRLGVWGWLPGGRLHSLASSQPLVIPAIGDANSLFQQDAFLFKNLNQIDSGILSVAAPYSGGWEEGGTVILIHYFGMTTTDKC